MTPTQFLSEMQKRSAIENSKNLKESIFFIEANSFEILELWKAYKDECRWEEVSLGCYEIIGYLDNKHEKPVSLSFSFAKVYGQTICFYESISRYSDSEMIEKWIMEKYPVKWDSGTRTAMTNAQNFHHALQAAKEASLNVVEEVDPIPPHIENPDLSNLINECYSYLSDTLKNGTTDDDAEHYIFETAMKTLFGKDIFKFINSHTN